MALKKWNKLINNNLLLNNVNCTILLYNFCSFFKIIYISFVRKPIIYIYRYVAGIINTPQKLNFIAHEQKRHHRSGTIKFLLSRMHQIIFHHLYVKFSRFLISHTHRKIRQTYNKKKTSCDTNKNCITFFC